MRRGGVGLVPRKTFEMALDQAFDAIGHRFRGVDANRHLGQLVLDHAEVRDGRAESFAVFRVGERNCENVLRAADGEGAEFQAAEVQDIESDDVAAADFAEHIFDGHRHVIEERSAWWNCP